MTNPINRRDMLRRIAGTAGVVWVAPAVMGVGRVAGATLSTCPLFYDFDDGTLQGWTRANTGPGQWQVSSTASAAGGFSVWFGTLGSADSLHPTAGNDSYAGTSAGTLVSPAVTVTGADSITFRIRLAIENGAAYDTLDLNIIQGANRTSLWDKTAGGFTVIDHPANPTATWDLYTTNGAFLTFTVPVGSPAGINLANPVQFEFAFDSRDDFLNNTEGVFIDSVSLPCSTPPAAPLGGLERQHPPAVFPPGYQIPSSPEGTRELLDIRKE